jgi:hypothetical protein
MTKIIISNEQHNHLISQGIKDLLKELTVEGLSDEERKQILKKYEWINKLFGHS